MTAGPCVLLVDADAGDRALAARELAGEFPDTRAIEVADAAAFETVLERGGFDLVVTEFRLGWSDGLSVFREIKYRYPEVPVIMFTGAGSEEIAVEAMRAGLDDYVLKSPDHVARLRVAAAAVLERARERRARREAEEALRSSEAHLRALFASMSDVILVLDRDGRYLEIAPTSPELLYRPVEEVLGKTVHEIFPPEQADTFLEAIRKALDTHATVEIEYMLQIRGTDMWFEASISPMLEDSVCWVARDITERKRMEERLRESEQRYETFINATDDLAFVKDDELRYLVVNRANAEFLGRPAEEIVGRTDPELMPPEAAEGCRRSDLLALGQNRVVVTEERVGGRVYELHKFPVALEEGRVGVGGWARDITERKQMEDELRRRDERIRELLGRVVRAQEEERQRLAVEIHDDPIQVMSSVALRLGALRRSVRDAEALETVERLEETVTSAVSRLRRLVFELRPRVLDEEGLAPALRAYLDDLSEQTRIECTLVNRLGAEPPPAARTVLYRIAQEALVNVRKHANAGRVDVVLEPRAAGYAVRIADDGDGFDLGTGSEEPPGHLGLEAMKERAETAGGWWRIESGPGSGTTVEFWIPAEVG